MCVSKSVYCGFSLGLFNIVFVTVLYSVLYMYS